MLPTLRESEKAMTEIPQDTVIFRRWNDTGEIVAVFPERPADDLGRYCQSYDETG